MSETDTQEGQKPADTDTESEVVLNRAAVKTFDEGYVKELRAEAARHRKEAQEAKTKAQEYEERDKSELEKAQGKATKYEQEAAAARAELTRYQVANEKSVPADAVEFLRGNTREDLEASADKILALVKTEEKVPDFDGGAKEAAPEPESPEEGFNKSVLGALGIPT